jgi:hypothetical protein
MQSPHPFRVVCSLSTRDTFITELRRSEIYAKHICAVVRRKIQVATSYVRGVGEFLHQRGVVSCIFYIHNCSVRGTHRGSQEHGIVKHLLDLQQLDVENKSAVCRNPGHRFAAVSQVCWNRESTLATNRHSCNTNVPALNNFTDAKLEAKRFAFLVRCC